MISNIGSTKRLFNILLLLISLFSNLIDLILALNWLFWQVILIKIYLDADEQIRSSRRVEQSNNEETTDDIAERDKRDLSRKNSPLVVPKGALMLQNNNSTVEELVDEVIENLKL